MPRLRDELLPEHREQLRLNAKMSRIAGRARILLEENWESLNGIDHVLVTLFSKCLNTFRSIQILTRNGYIEDGLCLLRVLAETTINLSYSIKSGPAQAAQRYIDWATFEAIRRARIHDFYRGTALYSREGEQALLESEREIQARYTSQEIEDFKRKGVFAIPVEQRARIGGEHDLYSYSYRITSRNVHAIDVAETRVCREALGGEEFGRFRKVRLDHLLSVSRYCLGTLCLWFNRQYRLGLDARLENLNEEDTFPVQL